MAITTLGAESARVIPFPFPRYIEPNDLAARRVVRNSLRAAIDELVSLLDALDGDPEFEPTGDDEPTGDEQDASVTEWHARHWRERRAGVELVTVDEDCEDADPREEDDPGGCEHDGREPENAF